MLCVFVEVRNHVLYIFGTASHSLNPEEVVTDQYVVGTVSVTDKQYGILVE